MPVLTRAPSSVVSAGSWAGGGNLYADDGAYASLVPAATNTDYPITVGGFDFSAIPDGSTINSVTVTTEAKSSGNSSTFRADALAGATVVGSLASVTLTTTDTKRTFTATPTLAQLKAANFAVSLVGRKSTTQARIITADMVSVAVDYTAAVARASGDPIERRAVSANLVGSGTTVSTSITVSGNERYLLVVLAFNNDDYQTGQSVVLQTGGAGTPLTLLGHAVYDDDARTELWGLVNPPVGTFTLTGTISAALTLVDQHLFIGAWALSGVHQSTPVRALSPGVAALDQASVTTVNPSQPGDLVIGGFFQERINRWAGTITVGPPAVQDWVRYGNNGDGAQGASVVATGTSTSITWTATVATSTNIAAITAAFAPAAPPPPPAPALTYSWAGIPEDDGAFRASCRTTSAASVRLVVATDAALTTGRVLSQPVTPDGDGWSKASVAGLPAGTYHYGWELTSANASTTVTPAQGSFVIGATSETVIFGSCMKSPPNYTSSTSDVLVRALAHNPTMFFHLGDFHYRDESSTSQAVHRGHLEAQIAANTGLRDMLAKTPTLYITSDHDSGAPDVVTHPSMAQALAAYRQVVPHLPTVTSGANYYSFTRLGGRVRFIVTDQRFERTSTSMLGTAQHAWFKQQLAMPEPVKIWVQDSTWKSDVPVGLDRWADYAADRDDIAAFVTSNDVGTVITIAGDQHALCADNGSNNPWGGFRVWGAAPFDRSSSHKASGWSNGIWPTTPSSTEVQQYGRIVLDGSNPDQVTVSFAGYDSTNTVRVSDSVTVSVAPATPSWSLWDGTTEAPLTFEGVVGRDGTVTPGTLAPS